MMMQPEDGVICRRLFRRSVCAFGVFRGPLHANRTVVLLVVVVVLLVMMFRHPDSDTRDDRVAKLAEFAQRSRFLRRLSHILFEEVLAKSKIWLNYSLFETWSLRWWINANCVSILLMRKTYLFRKSTGFSKYGVDESSHSTRNRCL